MITKDYQFPQITETIYNTIKEFRTAVRGENPPIGAVGGDITFHITPTNIGDFIEVEVAGQKMNLTDSMFGQDKEIEIKKTGYTSWEAEIK